MKMSVGATGFTFGFLVLELRINSLSVVSLFIQVKNKLSLDALLSDICISTSVVPTYLPTHYFETKEPSGEVREFNLVDDGVVANNPTLIAIAEVVSEIHKGTSYLSTMNPIDLGQLLVLSLGIGSAKQEKKYTANVSTKWGALEWLVDGGSTSLLDILTQGSAEMVDFHLDVIFSALKPETNYLRIQDDMLTSDVALLDIATRENMEKLVEVGERLLKKPVSRVNWDTDLLESTNQQISNGEALIRLAKILSEEKQLRARTSI